MTDVLSTSVGPPTAASTPPPVPLTVTAARPATPAAPAAARTGPARPSSGPVYIAAITLFACFALLFASRMAAGEDPALGIRPGVLAQPAPRGVLQKVVITRRISVNGMTRRQMRRRGVRHVIVVRQPAAAPAPVAAVARGADGTPAPTTVAATSAPAATGGTRRSSSGGGTTVTTDTPSSSPTVTPTGTAPAPVAATPAPSAPAPAPVAATPAPAPVVTATS